MRQSLSLTLLMFFSSTTLAASNFMYSSPTYIELLSWTGTGNTLQGTYQTVKATQDMWGRPMVSSTNGNFTGTLNKGSVLLTFPGAFGSKTQYQATLKGKTLTINYPKNSGGFDAVPYASVTTEQYNGQVKKLQQTVAQQQKLWDQQEAARRRKQNLIDQVTAAAGLLDRLFEQVDGFEADAQSAVRDLKGVVDEPASAVNDVKRAAADALDAYQDSEDCTDYGYAETQVGYVETQVGYVDTQVGYQQTTIGYHDDLPGKVPLLKGQLNGAFKAYEEALKKAGNLVSREYTSNHVKAALSRLDRAGSQVTQAIKEVQQAGRKHQDQAAQILKDVKRQTPMPAECQ